MTNRTFHHPPGGFTLDDGPGKHRIGLLALVNDHVVERDMMAMRPDDDEVMLFTSRVPFADECTPETLAAMADVLTGATDMILPGSQLDAVIYSCTSGTAAIGYEKVQECVQLARPGVPCITPVTAAHAAFRALGLTRIAVLAPYTDDVTATTVQALEDGGVEVTKISNFDITRARDISAVVPASIHAAALFANDPGAEGLFVSCTDFRAVEVLDRIEREIGKPVVTANQATFWQAARCSGYTKPIAGFGKLLSL